MTSLTNNSVRAPNELVTENYLGQVNAKHMTAWNYPTYFKAGLESTAAFYYRITGNYSWTYAGENSERLHADYPVTVAPFDPPSGGSIFTRTIPFPDRHAIGVLQRLHTEYFTANPADATCAANLQPERSAREWIDAGYFMGTSQFGRLVVPAAVRRERTENQGKTYERGFLRVRLGDYADTFFSDAARYRFTDKLMAIASFSQSTQRANLSSISGVLTINDTARSGALLNPELKPKNGNNYSLRLEQYFEPVGTFSVRVFQFDISDLQRSLTGLRAENLGLGGDYPGYTFTSTSNVGDFTKKGIGFAYSQRLTYLRALRGTLNQFEIQGASWVLGLKGTF